VTGHGSCIGPGALDQGFTGYLVTWLPGRRSCHIDPDKAEDGLTLFQGDRPLARTAEQRVAAHVSPCHHRVQSGVGVAEYLLHLVVRARGCRERVAPVGEMEPQRFSVAATVSARHHGLRKVVFGIDDHLGRKPRGVRIWVEAQWTDRRCSRFAHLDRSIGRPDPVGSAATRHVRVNLAYTDAQGRSTRREVEPMIFALTGGRWLLVGWCRLRDDVRWLDLSRIQAATATRHPCAGHPVTEIGAPPEQARPAGI